MIRLKIAFVLRLVDDYSGQCIQKKKFRFTIGERVVHPVEKEEGLYVFLEPQETETRVWIEGTDYYPCSVNVQKKLLNPEEPVVDVRMYGMPGKSFPYSCELVSGILEKKKVTFPVEIYRKRTKPTGLTFREYRKIEEEYWFFFQGFTREKLVGRTYVLGSGKDAVPFILTGKRGINEYRVELLTKEPDQIPTGTPLERIYRSVTDRAGAYAIPVEPGEETSTQEVMILQHTLPS